MNKRAVPDYYDIIKEPMALSTIKAKIAQREYKNVSEFVRDLALIPHNAQVYNRQDSQAYVDALEVKKVIERELKRLVDDKIVPETVATLPFLGEIPEQDPLLPEEEEEEEEDDDEEELEVDEEEDDDEEDEEGTDEEDEATETVTRGKDDASSAWVMAVYEDQDGKEYKYKRSYVFTMPDSGDEDVAHIDVAAI